MSIKLFTITHKPFTPPPDPLYVPLHVGRAGSESLGFLGDDTGDSISEQNPFFCELTGMYWLWKNCQDVDYLGICHYRRYLLNEQGELFTEEQLLALLQKYDMLTSKLLTLSCSYLEGFSANHHRKDLLTTEAVIQEKFPEYLPLFHQLVNGPHTYFGNILITSKPEYDRYCQWLFSLLFEVQKRTDFTGYNRYQKRLFGFLSEFLQTLWIAFHQLRVCECMVGMVGEKYETKLLKEQLAVLLSLRDYPQAKSCFLDHYRKRPDILMEASDVNGELRLCMQIISTCEFEDAAYGHCILDRIRDYSALIRHFHHLNTAVNAYLLLPSSENRALVHQSPDSTPIAVEIAVKLFCTDEKRQSEVIARLCN